MNKLAPFTAIKYTTSDGENCVATKNNGIVTIQGQKGVRQVPYDQFMAEFIKDQSKKPLERTPKSDSVSFKSRYEEKSIYDNLKVKNGFWSGKRTIKGEIGKYNVDLKIKSNFWGTKSTLSGTIDGKPVELTMKNKKVSGELADEHKKLAPALKMMMMDKRNYDEKMMLIALCV